MEPVGRNYKRHKVGLFSVSLAEDQQKDFFGREACTQTEVTEISNLQVSTYLFIQLIHTPQPQFNEYFNDNIQ